MSTIVIVRRFGRIALLAAGSVVLCGCAHRSIAKNETPATPAGRTVVEYRQVFLTGSHIPVLVPKSPTARPVPTFSPLVILTPEEWTRSVAPAISPLR